jgi:alpha-tubulin suppressor-like RCC1 family protein
MIGNGTNMNTNIPQLVSLERLPSLTGYDVKKICCGGAHTLALLVKDIKPGLVNPWGKATKVIAWGYGLNGQLGDGKACHSFLPVKVIIPKCDVIVEISAGECE